MTGNELKRVLDTQLFVPIDSSAAGMLHDVSVHMADELDIAAAENLVFGFLEDCVIFRFKQSFREKCMEFYGQIPNIPTVVYTILELYVIRLALLSEVVDDNEKVQISLVVRNAAILKKGKWQGVMCQEWLSEIFEYADSHKQKPIMTKPYNELIDAVISSNDWDESGLDISQKDIYIQLRSLCVAGMRGKVNSYIRGAEFKSLSSPFVQTYVIVKNMINDWQWKYVEQSPVNKLVDILGKDVKKRKNLGNITNEIRIGLPATQMIKPKMKSSILLKKIYNGNPSGIDGMMFTSLEFGVYLYYELLLETYEDL